MCITKTVRYVLKKCSTYKKDRLFFSCYTNESVKSEIRNLLNYWTSAKKREMNYVYFYYLVISKTCCHYGVGTKRRLSKRR